MADNLDVAEGPLKLMQRAKTYLGGLLEQSKESREAALAQKERLLENLREVDERMAAVKTEYNHMKDQFERSQRCGEFRPFLTPAESSLTPTGRTKTCRE